MSVTVSMPVWAAKLRRPARYKVMYGGRGGAKSWSVAAQLLLDAYDKPMRIVCAREVQKSIGESSKQLLDDWIKRFGMEGFFESRQQYIRGANGSYFFFRGMSQSYRTAEQAKSLEDVDRLWFEEAQTMSRRSWEIIRPTLRKQDSEIWLTFNPRYRSDPAYHDFVVRPFDDAVVINVNYDANPWFPQVLEQERLQCKRNEPERYSHVWLGQPDDEGEARLVLPFALIERCVDAHLKLKVPEEAFEGRYDVGLDVADTGVDKNAMIARRGPLVTYADTWSSQRLGQTARRADTFCREHGVRRMYYDVGGPGAGIRSYLLEMGERGYFAEPVNFGGEVTGKEREFSYRVLNKDFFMRRNSQLAWNLRLRAQRTARALDGDDVNPEQCLFVDGRLGNLNEFLTQLAQPVWDENTSGRLVIDKTPEDAPSPDMYDATALAFAWDSRDGLRAS